LIRYSIQSLGRFILLSLVFTTLLFSGGKQDVENESGGINQLKKMQKELQEVESKLNKVRQAQEKIKALQKVITNTLNRQKELATIYLDLRKACRIQKAKDEIGGFKYSRIERRFQDCQQEVQATIGNNGLEHRKFMRDIKRFKKMVQNHVYEAEDLIDKSKLLEKKRKYLKISLEQIKEMVNTK